MKADVYPSDQLKDLAAELAEWLAVSELPVDRVTMNATALAVWELDGTHGLSAAVNTGEWHHQLQREARAFAYARSHVRGGKPHITEVAESPLVTALEDALQALRAEADRDVTLRLLRSARHHTTALWLHGAWDNDELIVLQSPMINTQQRLDGPRFLKALANSDVAGLSNAVPMADVVPFAFPARTSDINKWQPNRANRLWL